ncbi:MAG: nucleotide-binding protein [Pirellula sp.]|nr:nucleotide-binding protein [Pirellula sp.]
MDRPDLEVGRHRHALDALALANSLSRSGKIVYRPIKAWAQRRGIRQFRMLDVACGGGDVVLDVQRRACRDRLQADVVGYDISPTAVCRAQERASRKPSHCKAEASFVQKDILEPLPERSFDVVSCSLFLHHLTEVQAVQLLRSMAAATRRLLVINDLIRCRLGYWAAQSVCHLISKSDILRTDGPQSVAGAFRTEEVRRLAERAGLHGAQIRRAWPFRFFLTWETLS